MFAFSFTIFHLNLQNWLEAYFINGLEVLFFSYLNSNEVIAAKFCMWHASYVVVACTIICEVINWTVIELKQGKV